MDELFNKLFVAINSIHAEIENIKVNMASKKDLESMVTKTDLDDVYIALKRDLEATEGRLDRKIDRNFR